METATATPGYLTQPIRPLVNDGGRLEVSSVVGPETPTNSPTPKFSDLLAIINPAQHLPIIGPLYRHITGDEPHPAAKILGGLLYGGPVGLVSAAFNAIFEQATGKSVIETAVALATGSAAGATVAAVQDDATSLFATSSATPEVPAALAAEPAPPAPAPALATQAAAPVVAAPTAAARLAGHDLPYYRTNAGTRLPGHGSAGAPTGAAGLTPNVKRLVTPVLGPEPIAATRPQTPSAQSFEVGFLRNMKILESQRTASAAKATVLDRFE